MRMPEILTLATRRSPLALAQVELVVNQLLKLGYHREQIVIKALKTQGDKDLSSPLFHKGGKGLFVREIEQLILEEEADIAVHSLKDLPLQGPDNLILAGFLSEGHFEDVLVSYQSQHLKPGDIVGTSSLRRASQMKILFPEIIIKPIRGSVQTRLDKLDGQNFHHTLLARAGLERLSLVSQRPWRSFCPEHEITPAFTQGIIGLQILKGRSYLADLLASMTYPDIVWRQDIERYVASLFGATCQSAFGVFAQRYAYESSSHLLHIYAYTSPQHWKRVKLAFSRKEELPELLEKHFSFKTICWSLCEEEFF